MHTKAVYRAAQAYTDAGLVALRFNFRGVGTSTGSYDEGVGERDVLRAAIDWLEAAYASLPLFVGGFSFGSMVGLSVGAEDDRISALLGMGLPVTLDDRYDYRYLKETDKPVLIVQGEDDEYGAGALVEEKLTALGPHITVVRIPGSDHFFTGRLDELRVAVRGYYESGPGSRLLAIV